MQQPRGCRAAAPGVPNVAHTRSVLGPGLAAPCPVLIGSAHGPVRPGRLVVGRPDVSARARRRGTPRRQVRQRGHQHADRQARGGGRARPGAPPRARQPQAQRQPATARAALEQEARRELGQESSGASPAALARFRRYELEERARRSGPRAPVPRDAAAQLDEQPGERLAAAEAPGGGALQQLQRVQWHPAQPARLRGGLAAMTEGPHTCKRHCSSSRASGAPLHNFLVCAGWQQCEHNTPMTQSVVMPMQK